MKVLNESQFFMWRTLFALAHADDVVTEEEVRFMAEAMEDLPLSDEQRAILNKDVSEAQNIEVMFAGITEVRDQAQFFNFARELVHIDGDYGHEEQQIMLKLKETHLQNTNIDDLIAGPVGLQLEGDDEGEMFKNTTRKKSFKDNVFSFRDRFLKDRFKD